MIIDRKALPEGYSTDKKEGFYAEFNKDKTLSHFGCYRDGKPCGWQLFLNQEKSEGRAELHDEERFPECNENEDMEEGDLESFSEWALKWIDTITDAGSSIFKCSFCGKMQTEVKKIIAGPRVYICNECIELCNEIMQEEFGD